MSPMPPTQPPAGTVVDPPAGGYVDISDLIIGGGNGNTQTPVTTIPITIPISGGFSGGRRRRLLQVLVGGTPPPADQVCQVGVQFEFFGSVFFSATVNDNYRRWNIQW
jgi:hypothetical protein